MKPGVIVTQTDPETVFNAPRLAPYGLAQGDEARVFPSDRAVETDGIADPKCDVKGHARKLPGTGGQFLARRARLKLRNPEGARARPLSRLKDRYEIVRRSDEVITV